MRVVLGTRHATMSGDGDLFAPLDGGQQGRIWLWLHRPVWRAWQFKKYDYMITLSWLASQDNKTGSA